MLRLLSVTPSLPSVPSLYFTCGATFPYAQGALNGGGFGGIGTLPGVSCYASSIPVFAICRPPVISKLL